MPAFNKFQKLLLVLISISMLPVLSFAHPLDPALLSMKESTPHKYDVIWKTPVSMTAERPLQVNLPAHCKIMSEQESAVSNASVVQRFSLDCGAAGLRGSELKVVGLAAWKTDALVRIEFLDKTTVHSVLREGSDAFIVPESQGPLQIARDYIVMGIEHILFGWDHLLFVLGLVLLVKSWRSLLWTISAFTIGHSITLSLAALGLVHVPQAWVEVLIAASILVVALELVRVRSGEVQQKTMRHPPIIVILFGLLHGLGFAGALAEVGLPEGDIPLALLTFNVGIEVGQLIFVAGVLAVMALLRRSQISWPRFAGELPAYVIGSLASFWIFERFTQI